jgi:hypothetical protein
MVSVVGCLPPDVLGELSDERGRDDGFIHRLLFAFPAPVRLRWTEESIGDEALAAYCDLYKCLSSLAPHLDGEPVVTGFSPAGKIAFIQWVTAHYDELERVDEPLRGPWAKLEAYAARLALVIQEIRFVAGEASGEDVDAESVDAAAELIAFFKSSARPVYARLQGDPDDVRVARVVDWARRRTKTTLTAREIRRAKVGGVRTPADAQAVLLELAERGLGRLHRPGRGSIVFTFFAGPAGAGCQDDRLEAPKQTGTVVSAGATSVPEPLLPGDVAPSLPPTGTERCCAESPRGSHHPPHLAPGTRAVDDQKLGEGGRSPVPGDPGYLEWLGPTGARPITRRERRLQRVLHLYLVRCSAGVAAASKAVSENTARDQEA